MKKVKIAFLMVLLTGIGFGGISCKKTAPEVVEDASATKEKTEAEGKSTVMIRKISADQFNEANELILRAKEAQADLYDKENYENAIHYFNQAKENNETDPEKAFEYLDLSRKLSQEAYYNSFKLRALEKKKEADRLISDLESQGIQATYQTSFAKAKELYGEGEKFFHEENYTASFAKYSETIDQLNHLSESQKKLRQENESKIKYIQDLISKAEKLGAEIYAEKDLAEAKKNLQTGTVQYKDFQFEEAKQSFGVAEKAALAAIEKANKALLEKKRLDALNAIKAAGKSLEKAAGKETLKDGKVEKSLDYQFEFEEELEVREGNSPNQNTPSGSSYQEILTKAAEYIEKAKESYYKTEYDMAIRYASIAKKIADSYSGSGIKTHYTVQLNPEKRDCLWRISEYDFIYNNPFYWPIIWKTNKEQILNPDLIYPGQKFAIPELD